MAAYSFYCSGQLSFAIYQRASMSTPQSQTRLPDWIKRSLNDSRDAKHQILSAQIVQSSERELLCSLSFHFSPDFPYSHGSECALPSTAANWSDLVLSPQSGSRGWFSTLEFNNAAVNAHSQLAPRAVFCLIWFDLCSEISQLTKTENTKKNKRKDKSFCAKISHQTQCSCLSLNQN